MLRRREEALPAGGSGHRREEAAPSARNQSALTNLLPASRIAGEIEQIV
jgi:hypothetical protein